MASSSTLLARARQFGSSSVVALSSRLLDQLGEACGVVGEATGVTGVFEDHRVCTHASGHRLFEGGIDHAIGAGHGIPRRQVVPRCRTRWGKEDWEVECALLCAERRRDAWAQVL